MSEENQNTSMSEADELTLLKQRAKMMGIDHSNNISVAKLREKINAKLEGTETPPEKPDQVNPLVGEISAAEKIDPNSPQAVRERLLRDEMKLVRLRITNLDPKKKDLPGEIFTLANEYLGTVRKYVPFGEVTDEGWHVPHCIYRLLDERRFLSIKVVKRNGQEHVEQSWAREFALEVLPPLTPEELQRLAATQAAAGLND